MALWAFVVFVLGSATVPCGAQTTYPSPGLEPLVNANEIIVYVCQNSISYTGNMALGFFTDGLPLVSSGKFYTSLYTDCVMTFVAPSNQRVLIRLDYYRTYSQDTLVLYNGANRNNAINNSVFLGDLYISTEAHPTYDPPVFNNFVSANNTLTVGFSANKVSDKGDDQTGFFGAFMMFPGHVNTLDLAFGRVVRIILYDKNNDVLTANAVKRPTVFSYYDPSNSQPDLSENSIWFVSAISTVGVTMSCPTGKTVTLWPLLDSSAASSSAATVCSAYAPPLNPCTLPGEGCFAIVMANATYYRTDERANGRPVYCSTGSGQRACVKFQRTAGGFSFAWQLLSPSGASIAFAISDAPLLELVPTNVPWVFSANNSLSNITTNCTICKPKICLNGGAYNPTMRICQCPVNYLMGYRCELEPNMTVLIRSPTSYSVINPGNWQSLKFQLPLINEQVAHAWIKFPKPLATVPVSCQIDFQDPVPGLPLIHDPLTFEIPAFMNNTEFLTVDLQDFLALRLVNYSWNLKDRNNATNNIVLKVFCTVASQTQFATNFATAVANQSRLVLYTDPVAAFSSVCPANTYQWAGECRRCGPRSEISSPVGVSGDVNCKCFTASTQTAFRCFNMTRNALSQVYGNGNFSLRALTDENLDTMFNVTGIVNFSALQGVLKYVSLASGTKAVSKLNVTAFFSDDTSYLWPNVALLNNSVLQLTAPSSATQDVDVVSLRVAVPTGAPVLLRDVGAMVECHSRTCIGPFCDTLSCQNGGACVNLSTNAVCRCLPGFNGPLCQNNIDDCQLGAPLKCPNGGICVDGIMNFSCSCPVGYTGSNCSTVKDMCSPDPCNGHGTCSFSNLVPGVFSCTCAAGYLEPFCIPDPCFGVNCNNGTCFKVTGVPTCQCNTNYTGTLCNILDTTTTVAETTTQPSSVGVVTTTMAGGQETTANKNTGSTTTASAIPVSTTSSIFGVTTTTPTKTPTTLPFVQTTDAGITAEPPPPTTAPHQLTQDGTLHTTQATMVYVNGPADIATVTRVVFEQQLRRFLIDLGILLVGSPSLVSFTESGNNSTNGTVVQLRFLDDGANLYFNFLKELETSGHLDFTAEPIAFKVRTNSTALLESWNTPQSSESSTASPLTTFADFKTTTSPQKSQIQSTPSSSLGLILGVVLGFVALAVILLVVVLVVRRSSTRRPPPKKSRASNSDSQLNIHSSIGIKSKLSFNSSRPTSENYEMPVSQNPMYVKTAAGIAMPQYMSPDSSEDSPNYNYASSQFASTGGYAFADNGQESYLQPVFMNPKYQAHMDSAAEYQAAYSVPMMDGRSFTATPGSVSYESHTPANEPQYALSTTIEAKSGFDSRGSLYAKPNALRAAPSRKTSINRGYLDVDAEPEV